MDRSWHLPSMGHRNLTRQLHIASGVVFPRIFLVCMADPDMGRVSKQILDDIITEVRESTVVYLWKNTASVIDWFKAIPEKEDNTFICFDIVEYYSSISEKLLRNTLSYAS